MTIGLKRDHLLRWFGLIVWMSLIFFLSHQEGEASAQLSNMVNNTIRSLLSAIGWESTGEGSGKMGWLVRKMAHVTEYALLFTLAARVISLYAVPGKVKIFSALFCLIYACTDEYHQTYIPGRTATLKDVGIDMIGICTGWVIYHIVEAENEQKPFRRNRVE